MNIRLPYIRIVQKNESLFLTKMDVYSLKKYINFSFRDPYSEQSEKNQLSNEEFINKLKDKGIDISNDPNGIQRRMNLTKINEIKKSMELPSELMPNSVLLCLDYDNEDDLYSFLDNIEGKLENETGFLVFDDTNLHFKVIDGQHRLAGMFLLKEEMQKNIEMPIILLLDSSREIISKIFGEINGKQTKVNKSILLDLLQEQVPTDEQLSIDKKLHELCFQLNENENSPFYHHIKMLGYGTGTISQSFLISGFNKVLKKIKKEPDIFFSTNILLYFTAIKDVFNEYWPNSFDNKNTNKSQIMKTNGIGALLKLFSDIIDLVDYNSDNFSELYEQYFRIIIKIEEFDWKNDESVKNGSSEKTQKLIYGKLLAKIQ